MLRRQQGWFWILLTVTGTLFLSHKAELPPTIQTPTIAEFGGVSLKIDVAMTPASREIGLSGRASIPGDYGMLFVFPKDSLYGFWMKNMLVPLDIFWLNSQGQVIFIAHNVSPASYPRVFYPTAPARYVLETVAGFARTHLIVVGTPLLLKDFPIVSK
jgi:uncharacterized membrane protein (UPF0127 family)